MKMLAALAVLCAAALLAVPVANGAKTQINAPASKMLRVGSHGKRVKDLQWLLANHKPNVFNGTKIKGTFKGNPNGSLGDKTGKAIVAYKWELGYPTRMLKPIAGPYLFELLLGKAQRPIAWVALASKRRTAPVPGPTPMALRIRAREISQLGVGEIPYGSNIGPQVVPYQRVTGAVGAAWCVSFQQAMFLWSGAGTFANDTASVYYAVDWARDRGLLRSTPKVGALVAFIDYDRYGHRISGTGHMGFVVRSGSGWFVYVAGNDGNAVREHFLRNNARAHVFIYLKGIAQ